MAGAGYKLFSTGDVLSASDVNTYLQQQTVMVFASAAARTTALASVLAEGMVSYLKDTDVVEIYTGAAWVSLDDPNAIQNALLTAKGSIVTATAASTPSALAVGANNTVLTADSTTATGLKWATPASGSTFAGCRIQNSGNQSIATSTDTALTFDTETYDTDAFHSTTTNTSRITIPAGKAGYYQFNGGVTWAAGSGIRDLNIYKNGARAAYFSQNAQSVNSASQTISDILYGAVGDYFELYVFQNNGSAINVQNVSSGGWTKFACAYLGA